MLSEEQVLVPFESGPGIPCSIWSAARSPRGIVLLGHGLGVDRDHETVRVPARVSALDHEAVVVVPEIPLHGVRDAHPRDPSGIVDRWQSFWAGGGATTLTAELGCVLRFARASYGPLPVSYFGLSLGTQYGIPFLAREPEVCAAVLGLFGSRPPPRSPLMNRDAPAVRCPVYFVQKLDDELHGADSTTHLYQRLGAAEKVLDATPGGHAETSMASVRKACAFLARGGRATTD